jgi:hypothetical protein
MIATDVCGQPAAIWQVTGTPPTRTEIISRLTNRQTLEAVALIQDAA